MLRKQLGRLLTGRLDLRRDQLTVDQLAAAFARASQRPLGHQSHRAPSLGRAPVPRARSPAPSEPVSGVSDCESGSPATTAPHVERAGGQLKLLLPRGSRRDSRRGPDCRVGRRPGVRWARSLAAASPRGSECEPRYATRWEFVHSRSDDGACEHYCFAGQRSYERCAWLLLVLDGIDSDP
jgi:hypothetical protein